MLMFNPVFLVFIYVSVFDSNTSYVNVQLGLGKTFVGSEKNLNTFYVNVQHRGSDIMK